MLGWRDRSRTPSSTWSSGRRTSRAHARSRGAIRLARGGDARRTGSYLALELADGVQGGVVEVDREPTWLPYVEVADIADTVGRARALGAGVLLEPREGPAGWRAVLAAPAGAPVALWQAKL